MSTEKEIKLLELRIETRTQNAQRMPNEWKNTKEANRWQDETEKLIEQKGKLVNK